ncbi:MAG: triose-phosphate isomerase [Microgenomates group bacterium]|nr:triose-phosphate isomerase [Microgenomates group bacterium]
MKYLIANWKANKNLTETNHWLDEFCQNKLTQIKNQVIICPPFPLIVPVYEKLKYFPNFSLGAQDISSFDIGSYTGEVCGKNLEEIIKYVIIGHSERRKYFQETETVLMKKTALALKYHFQPLYCIRNEKDAISEKVNFVVYEPTWAIGTGKNESLDQVLLLRKRLNLKPGIKFLYGGSVNEDNASLYLKSDKIDGLLIGGTSLNPKSFWEIIKQA